MTREVGEQRVGVRPVGVEALDVGEDDQLVRLERDGQRRGGGVGVDVVDLAVDVEVRGDAWTRRGCGRRRSGPCTASGLTLDDVADQAEVDLVAVDDACPCAGRRSRPASSPDRPTASGPCWLISPTSSRPTWPVEHHADDLHGLGRW